MFVIHATYNSCRHFVTAFTVVYSNGLIIKFVILLGTREGSPHEIPRILSSMSMSRPLKMSNKMSFHKANLKMSTILRLTLQKWHDNSLISEYQHLACNFSMK